MQTTKTLISSQCDAAVVAQADLRFLSNIITTTTTARSAQTDSVYSFLIGWLCALFVFLKNKTKKTTTQISVNISKQDLNLVRQQDC